MSFLTGLMEKGICKGIWKASPFPFLLVPDFIAWKIECMQRSFLYSRLCNRSSVVVQASYSSICRSKLLLEWTLFCLYSIPWVVHICRHCLIVGAGLRRCPSEPLMFACPPAWHNDWWNILLSDLELSIASWAQDLLHAERAIHCVFLPSPLQSEAAASLSICRPRVVRS